jgi:hypothetical protein
MRKALALTAALMFGTAAAEPDAPPDVETHTVPIVINCVDDMSRMIELLANDFGETWVIASEVSKVSVLWLFVNESHTTSTWVLQRAHKDFQEVCIVWSGTSPDAFSFVVNPNPVYPQLPKPTI